MPHESTLLDEREPDAATTSGGARATEASAARPAHDAHDDLRSLEAGLDRLQTSPERAQSAWRRFTTSVLPPILFVLALLVAWQLYIVIAQPRPDIVPGPVDVFNAMVLGWESGRLQLAVLTSLERGVVGFLIAGVEQVPPQLRRVGTVLGAGRTRLATLVVLPAALPGYVAGLKQGWAFSWRSLMAAEIIAAGGTIGFGLGSMLNQSRELADIAGVLATVLVILAIGILIELVFFAPLERRMLRRRGLLQGGTR